MRIGNQTYTNHSVVFVGDIKRNTTSMSGVALQCQGSSNCCETEGHWYYPDGTPVRNFTPGGTTLYMTRGGDNQDSLYLHRDSTSQALASSGGRGVGLYRCQLPATGTNGVIQIIYIGVYRLKITHDKGNIHTSWFALQSYGGRRGFTCFKLYACVFFQSVEKQAYILSR